MNSLPASSASLHLTQLIKIKFRGDIVVVGLLKYFSIGPASLQQKHHGSLLTMSPSVTVQQSLCTSYSPLCLECNNTDIDLLLRVLSCKIESQLNGSGN